MVLFFLVDIQLQDPYINSKDFHYVYHSQSSEPFIGNGDWGKCCIEEI